MTRRTLRLLDAQELTEELIRHCDTGVHSDSLPLVVVGAPGSGKTSLVAAFAKHYMESRPMVFTLVHIVSASPTSTDIREVLVRICHELIFQFPSIDWVLVSGSVTLTVCVCACLSLAEATSCV
jgi:ABC-type molybdenum transport system ATPase subunit/photorepair protein PhrA